MRDLGTLFLRFNESWVLAFKLGWEAVHLRPTNVCFEARLVKGMRCCRIFGEKSLLFSSLSHTDRAGRP